MRKVYDEQLSALREQLAKLCGSAAVAMDKATQALQGTDLALAEQVISEQKLIVAARARAEESAVALLALQQPVARDLRAIVSWIQIAGDLDRMGALAAHVAATARRRHPLPAVPDEVDDIFAEMGRVAVELAHRAQEVLVSRDPVNGARLREDDDTMDSLHRRLFTVLMERNWSRGVQAAVDVALLGRFYERFGDHAVEIGRRVVFEATGTLPAEQEVSTY